MTAPPTRRPAGPRSRPAAGTRTPAASLPVARVLVEVPLAHLDRPFDYLVDARDDAAAQPGVRVKVRFAGRPVGGFVLARVAESDHTGALGFLERVVSPEPVLTGEVFDLARAVADRYAGTVADVLRLAVPPRHARAEKQLSSEPAGIAAAGMAPVDPTGAGSVRSGTAPRGTGPSDETVGGPGAVESPPAPSQSLGSDGSPRAPGQSAAAGGLLRVAGAVGTAALAVSRREPAAAESTAPKEPSEPAAAESTAPKEPSGPGASGSAVPGRSAGLPGASGSAVPGRSAGVPGASGSAVPGRSPGLPGASGSTAPGQSPGAIGDVSGGAGARVPVESSGGATPARPVPVDAQASPPARWAQDYPAGAAFFRAIGQGRPARAVWQALPGEDWPTRLAEAAAAARSAGRGALLIVPDATDLARLDAALTATLGPGLHVTLAADLGPAERYRRFLTVRRGTRIVVAGTRAAAFAPVADLGLVALFDDGDDLLAEPRAPYPHAREVLMLRSAARSCPMLIGGYARTAEAQLLLDSGWAQALSPHRTLVRARSPWIRASGSEHVTGATSGAAHARIPPAAFDAARSALGRGAPVLVQVPRAGYVPAVACEHCRRPARCRRCRGPLRLAESAGLLQCRWCGTHEGHFRCGACGGSRVRATAVGAGRTAEEIGRAFPGTPILTSSGAAGRPDVPDAPAIVVATPGAEPTAPTGYGAALLLDGRLLLGRPDLRAAEETLRRWMGAAALVRPHRHGGQVVVAVESALPTVQALIRWDPAGHAEVELAARRELGFPPTVAMAAIDGTQVAMMDALDRLQLPPDAEVLGPVPVEDADRPATDLDDGAVDGSGDLLLGLDPGLPAGTRLRTLIRVPPANRKALCAALQALAAGRSARKLGGGLRITLDPAEMI